MSRAMNMRGFTMIEVTVALLVLAISITGVLALALGGLAATAEARRAEIAAALIADLAGRTRALDAVDWTLLPLPGPCEPLCTPGERAALELADWQSAVAAALPAGNASLETGAAGELLVTLAWQETGDVRQMRIGVAR
jgi:type IV pilus modification protein PilV